MNVLLAIIVLILIASNILLWIVVSSISVMIDLINDKNKNGGDSE